MALFRASPAVKDVHALPVELLSCIFSLGALDQRSDSPFLLRPDEDDCPVSVDFQLVVSQVCRHWRQVALRTSCLWTFLHFREPCHVARAEEFLKRASKSYPLDIVVDTVSPIEHIPGVTLCHEEMRAIFALITPHVARWHAFHLKVRANECKLVARQALSTCGPAPMLETLQLYHFEDYRTARNLYIATYRAPVIIFDNVLPALKNVSLIGVNLTWSHAPYLQQLHALELALHPDSIRPPYDAWDAMLRGSPHLRQLRLHYSGPRATDEPNERVCVPGLEELSLTDLDPDHLARLLPALELPRLSTLALDLPDQDFTSVIRFIAGVRDPGAGLSPSFPIASLQILRITALECTQEALSAFLRALLSLRVLELDFARLPGETFRVLLETVTPACKCSKPTAPVPVLPRLEEALMFGLPGQNLDEFIQFRESWAGSTTSCGEPRHAWRVTLPRVVVRPGHARGQDAVLTDLVEQGKVECLDDGLELELDEEDDLEPSEDGQFDEIET